MLEDLTMIATLPVNHLAVKKAQDEADKGAAGETMPPPKDASDDVEGSDRRREQVMQAQQPEPPHAPPGPPKSPEQPVVPPDDPNRQDVDREPSIDPPPLAPPVQAPSEKPGITEPPRPRA